MGLELEMLKEDKIKSILGTVKLALEYLGFGVYRIVAFTPNNWGEQLVLGEIEAIKTYEKYKLEYESGGDVYFPKTSTIKVADILRGSDSVGIIVTMFLDCALKIPTYSIAVSHIEGTYVFTYDKDILLSFTPYGQREEGAKKVVSPMFMELALEKAMRDDLAVYAKP